MALVPSIVRFTKGVLGLDLLAGFSEQRGTDDPQYRRLIDLITVAQVPELDGATWLALHMRHDAEQGPGTNKH